MASWSRKRRFVYAATATAILVIAITVPAFLIFYKAPTCFDGIKNGSEQDVDCGGKCVRLCASAFLPPDVAWTRFEEVAPGLYNVASYIVNPNPEGEARQVPYHIMMYDSRGVLIVEHNDTVYIPPQRSTLAFVRAIDTGKRIPTKVLFDFTGFPDWRSKVDPLSFLLIGEKKYTEDAAGSALTVSIKNTSVKSSGPISVYVILYDANNNAIGFSKTLIDDIGPDQSAIAPFTWPFSRNNKVISIEVLPVAE